MTPLAQAPTVRRLAEAALRLAAVLSEATTIQWQASPTPRPRDDTTERSKGGHSDPTVNVVADERRLALREQVVEGERLLEQAVELLDARRLLLEDAVDRWQGLI